MPKYNRELDASGLHCPLPILRAKKMLSDMKPEETLLIISTDPGSVKDFEAFAKQTGNRLLSSVEEASRFTFVMEKTS